ncbi:hypothetical protein JMJ35_005791 [Cladonia borealis]|uniref:Uncharacterized protein n=1 Tax=Cladonia borealis TaxID=184061 RepID=A0AA39R1Y8_9LECA|nr:hypothetical protein JMJ35_005791 [Cladonia borealis]
MRPSTENFVAAEPGELELEPEPEPEPELEFELEAGVGEGAEEEALFGIVVAAELSVVGEAATGATNENKNNRNDTEEGVITLDDGLDASQP